MMTSKDTRLFKKSRALIFLTLIIACALAALFYGLLTSLFYPERQLLLSPNAVQGIAAIYGSKEYSLNFAQQNGLIAIVNGAIHSGDAIESSSRDKGQIAVLVVYRFDEPSSTLSNISYDRMNGRAYFLLEDHGKQVSLVEGDAGRLKALLGNVRE